MATEVVGSPTLVYLFGLLDFAAGLAIVLVHNVWTVNWRVLITLIGWLLLIRGAARILVTDRLMGYARHSSATSSSIPCRAASSSFSASCCLILAMWPEGPKVRAGSLTDNPHLASNREFAPRRARAFPAPSPQTAGRFARGPRSFFIMPSHRSCGVCFTNGFDSSNT
jgi:hypothetical protein